MNSKITLSKEQLQATVSVLKSKNDLDVAVKGILDQMEAKLEKLTTVKKTRGQIKITHGIGKFETVKIEKAAFADVKVGDKVIVYQRSWEVKSIDAAGQKLTVAKALAVTPKGKEAYTKEYEKIISGVTFKRIVA